MKKTSAKIELSQKEIRDIQSAISFKIAKTKDALCSLKRLSDLQQRNASLLDCIRGAESELESLVQTSEKLSRY